MKNIFSFLTIVRNENCCGCLLVAKTQKEKKNKLHSITFFSNFLSAFFLSVFSLRTSDQISNSLFSRSILLHFAPFLLLRWLTISPIRYVKKSRLKIIENKYLQTFEDRESSSICVSKKN